MDLHSASFTKAAVVFAPKPALGLLLVVFERNGVVANGFVELALSVVAASAVHNEVGDGQSGTYRALWMQVMDDATRSVPRVASHDVVRVELEDPGEVSVRTVDLSRLEERHSAAETCVDVLWSTLENAGEVAYCHVP